MGEARGSFGTDAGSLIRIIPGAVLRPGRHDNGGAEIQSEVEKPHT